MRKRIRRILGCGSGLCGMLAFALGLCTSGVAPAWAASPLPLELNKLEPLGAGSGTGAGTGASGCRAYLVVQNPGAAPIEQLRLDLVLFGTDGVIGRRVAVELGPLSAGKTAVRLFDLPGLSCEAVGRMLVNDVLACDPGAQADRAACLDRLQVSSRSPVPLVK